MALGDRILRLTDFFLRSVLAFGLVPSLLPASAVLNLYTEQIKSGATGGTIGGIGYYNPSDPTLQVNNRVVTPFPNGPQDNPRIKVQHTLKYENGNAVNRNRETGCTMWCAYTDGDLGYSTAVASGHANAETQRLGAYTRAEANGYGPGALATAEAIVNARFTLDAGTSGLSNGTEVDMIWLYHLEGKTVVTGKSAPSYTGSLASASSNAVITRVGSGNGEGGVDELASVTFHLQSEIQHGFPSSPGVNSGYAHGEERWTASSNADFYKSDLRRWENDYDGESADISKTVVVDSRTGFFGLDYVPFKAKIGETYEIALDVSLFSTLGQGASAFQPNRYGSATNDYFGTLLGGVQFANSGTGAQLIFSPAAAAETPEPSTLALSGLGMLAAWVIRRRG